MTPCYSRLRQPDSMLLNVYLAIKGVELRRSVDLEMENLVSSAIADIRADVEKEAEDEIN